MVKHDAELIPGSLKSGTFCLCEGLYHFTIEIFSMEGNVYSSKVANELKSVGNWNLGGYETYLYFFA